MLAPDNEGRPQGDSAGVECAAAGGVQVNGGAATQAVAPVVSEAVHNNGTKKHRYRKVEVRTWADEKFRALSPMPASGQSLWLFLMTGPHTSPIAGLFRAGRAGMAEELGWELEDFDKAFREVVEKGMVKADLKARLVWLPKALKHNKPESPNVVVSWRSELDVLPECDLKREAVSYIRAFVESLGPSYLIAFDEEKAPKKPDSKASPEASSKASPKPSTKTMANQEQEQEQEQEQDSETPSSPASPLTSAGDADAAAGAKDSAADKAAARAMRLAQVTRDAIETFNESKLTKAKGGLVANVDPDVGADKRQKQVAKSLAVARDICRKDYDSDLIVRDFWVDYWAECLADEHKSGRAGGGKDHGNWVPTFEYLTREATMLEIYDRVVSRAAEGGQ
ncbi:hypothetical protein [Lysobacter fragariae]